MLDKPSSTLVAPHLLQGARVGRCHRLQREHAVAFAMGSHHRLGEGSLVYSMPVEAVRSVVVRQHPPFHCGVHTTVEKLLCDCEKTLLQYCLQQ